MRILNCGILFLALFLFACKAEGPRSPEEAYNSFRDACLKKDAVQAERLLSGRSIEEIKAIILMIKAMNESQLKALGQKFGMDPDRMKRLSVKDYLSMQLLISDGADNDIFREIVKNNLVGVDKNNGKAIVRIENGMELSFIKEGRYWKFDMEELSGD